MEIKVQNFSKIKIDISLTHVFLEMIGKIPSHFFDDERNGKEDNDSCSSTMSKSSENSKSLIPKRISRPIDAASEKEEIFEKGEQWGQEEQKNTGWENSTRAKDDTNADPKKSSSGKKVDTNTVSQTFEFDAKFTPCELQIICLKSSERQIEMLQKFSRNFNFEKITSQNPIVAGNSYLYEINEAKEIMSETDFFKRAYLEVSTLQSNLTVARILLTTNSSYAEYLDSSTVGLNSIILRENGNYVQCPNWITNPNVIDKTVFSNFGIIPVLTTSQTIVASFQRGKSSMYLLERLYGTNQNFTAKIRTSLSPNGITEKYTVILQPHFDSLQKSFLNNRNCQNFNKLRFSSIDYTYRKF